MFDNIYLYKLSLDINIYNWNLTTDLTEKIKSVLSHEIHHGFNYIKRLHKSKALVLTKVRNTVNGLYAKLYTQYPMFKYFMNAFYLNLPEERDARIQQLYAEIEKYKNEDVDTIINQVNNLSVYKDFKKQECTKKHRGTQCHDRKIHHKRQVSIPEQRYKRRVHEIVRRQ
jgi:predicted Zn-dependent protease with MMP-like domain